MQIGEPIPGVAGATTLTTNVSGTLAGVVLGAAGTVFTSNGTTSAPSFQAAGVSTDPLALHQANNLSDVASTSASRTNLGLGTAATQASSVFASSSVTISAGTGLTGGGDLTAGRTLAVSFGTTSSTVCVGNDSRLSDTRTPTGSAGGSLSGTYPNPGLASGLTLAGKTRTDSHYGTMTTLTDGSTVTIDASVSNLNQVTIAGNRTLAVTNISTGQSVTLRVVQGSGGSHLISAYPGTVTWFTSDNNPPTLATTAGHVNYVSFVCTGAGTYDGFSGGSSGA